MVACGSRNDGLILQKRSRVAKQDTVCFEDLVSGEREMEENERWHKSTLPFLYKNFVNSICELFYMKTLPFSTQLWKKAKFFYI